MERYISFRSVFREFYLTEVYIQMLLIWFTMFSLMVREYKSSPQVLSAVKQETISCFF